MQFLCLLLRWRLSGSSWPSSWSRSTGSGRNYFTFWEEKKPFCRPQTAPNYLTSLNKFSSENGSGSEPSKWPSGLVDPWQAVRRLKCFGLVQYWPQFWMSQQFQQFWAAAHSMYKPEHFLVSYLKELCTFTTYFLQFFVQWEKCSRKIL